MNTEEREMFMLLKMEMWYWIVGACFGGTSLYFADRVGATGKVISFEFFPDNITVFKENHAVKSAAKFSYYTRTQSSMG